MLLHEPLISSGFWRIITRYILTLTAKQTDDLGGKYPGKYQKGIFLKAFTLFPFLTVRITRIFEKNRTKMGNNRVL